MKYNLRQFGDLDSTNIKAKELAVKGVEPWTVVAAVTQNKGYGRKGTGWYSPKGGLYFSIILPKSNIDDLQTLTILAAYAVALAVKDNYALEPMIKLPNDVYLNGKKIGGILTENVLGRTVKSSVMGIGLDTNIEKFPSELEKIATSLKMELGKEVDSQKILDQIIGELQKTMETISD